MDERTLLYLSLFVFAVSTAALLVFSNCPLIYSDDMGLHYGECVRMCGVVTSSYSLDKGCVYQMDDGRGVFRAVDFRNECMGGYICFEGRIEEYRGNAELVVLRVA